MGNTVTESLHGFNDMNNPLVYTVHCELKPYPFPEGMAIPRLMPYQEYPWNGDGYLAAEVLRLKAAHNIMSAIETGTCLGSTALWLAEHFAEVNTAEVNGAYFTLARKRMEPVLKDSPVPVMIHYGSSLDMLHKVSAGFYFLDAHWNEHCPLLEELEVIAKEGVRPCIIIHDFQVPGHPEMGFDKFPDGGTPFCYNLIEPYLIAIYGEEGFETNYPDKVEGANRGWISVEPVR